MPGKTCNVNDHNYELDNADVTRKSAEGGKTEIYKTLWCTKCGVTKEIKVATWEKKADKPF
jgi:hypothetical protein